MLTDTLPLNPFIGATLTVTGWLIVDPAKTLILEGAIVSEKSGTGTGAVTVSVVAAVCTNVPAVPVSVTVAEPATVVEAAFKVIVWALPGVRVSAEGLAVTPAGSPETATLTVPVNDPAALARTDMVADPPGASDTVAGVALSV